MRGQWHEHEAGLFEGTERSFRPNYAADLVDDWIPSLEGVRAKLETGAQVADVGCGHGASTVLMARGYPDSEFVGFDYHPASIDSARRRAGDNLKPIGRVFYAASTLICTPASVAQELGLALAARAGEEARRRFAREGGFSRIRRAGETPFNTVLKARP